MKRRFLEEEATEISITGKIIIINHLLRALDFRTTGHTFESFCAYICGGRVTGGEGGAGRNAGEGGPSATPVDSAPGGDGGANTGGGGAGGGHGSGTGGNGGSGIVVVRYRVT